MTLHHTPQEVALLNFWYEFDNTFAYDRPDDVVGAIDIVNPYDRLLPKYIEFRNDNMSQEKIRGVNSSNRTFKFLCRNMI
jgi:hypothetical protein